MRNLLERRGKVSELCQLGVKSGKIVHQKLRMPPLRGICSRFA